MGYKLPERQASFNIVYRSYKHDARKAKRIFALSENEFRKITSSNCFYCGCVPHQVKTPNPVHHKPNGIYLFNGIDRLDSNKGYILKNCIPCCWVCNRAKNKMSQPDFVKWIIHLYRHITDLLRTPMQPNVVGYGGLIKQELHRSQTQQLTEQENQSD